MILNLPSFILVFTRERTLAFRK